MCSNGAEAERPNVAGKNTLTRSREPAINPPAQGQAVLRNASLGALGGTWGRSPHEQCEVPCAPTAPRRNARTSRARTRSLEAVNPLSTRPPRVRPCFATRPSALSGEHGGEAPMNSVKSHVLQRRRGGTP